MRSCSIAIILALASPAATAGLKFGAAIANLNVDEGETDFASQTLDLFAVRPSARASLEGSMTSVDLDAEAFIRSQLFQRSAVASSRVEFTDEVTVTAPGVPPGARLTLRLPFYLIGSTSINTGSGILCSARVAAVGPNNQRWEQSSANDGGPLVNDPNGTMAFDIPVVEGDPLQSEVLVAFTAESICGIPGSNFPSNYFSSTDGSLRAQFQKASVKVLDEDGNVLPVWNIESESDLDYGEGDAPAVLSKPTPEISFPDDAPGTIRLSWQTSELERYILESSADGENWSTAATVSGDDLTATIDLPHPGPRHFFRLVSQFNATGGIWTP